MRPTLLSLTSTRIGIYSHSTQVKFMIRSVEIDTYFNIIMIRDLVTYLLNNLLLTDLNTRKKTETYPSGLAKFGLFNTLDKDLTEENTLKLLEESLDSEYLDLN